MPGRSATSSSAYGSFYGSPGFQTLPPRKSLADDDSQQALLKALASPRGTPTRPPSAVCPPASSSGGGGGNAPARVRPVGPPCDRCDGKHKTADCPYFKGDRDDHEDAREHLDKGGGPEDPDAPPVIVRGRIVPQPGDGSCLFHSLGHALDTSHSQLRELVMRWVEANPDATIAGAPLKKWVGWDASLDTRAYAARMRTPGSWGGALEMAVIAQLKEVAIHVHERDKSARGQFRRIATFGEADSTRVANVLYSGRVHYDALEVFG